MIKQVFALSFLFALSGLAQGPYNWPKGEPTGKELLVFTYKDGAQIRFTLAQAVELYEKLYAASDPGLPENSVWPFDLKRRLTWLRVNAYVTPDADLPPQWKKSGLSGPTSLGHGYYCIPPGFREFQPCVSMYVIPLMREYRLERLMFVELDQGFKNAFAILLAHEQIHEERGQESLSKDRSLYDELREEVRAMFITVTEVIRPLRDANQPLSSMFAVFENTLAECGYKLPCQGFEDTIKRLKGIE